MSSYSIKYFGFRLARLYSFFPDVTHSCSNLVSYKRKSKFVNGRRGEIVFSNRLLTRVPQTNL